MKKHNGHSNGHASPQTPPGYPQTALARAEPGFAHGSGQPLIGHSLQNWESALARTQANHAPPVKAKRQMPATSTFPGLSRILLQPRVLKSVPIGDSGDQGIGLHVREGGVMVQVEPWSPMQVGDLLELFWGAPDDQQSPGCPGTAATSKTLQFPDELNKAVLLSVPEDDVVAGWFNVVCRVTRANTGFQELSPSLRVLVKLDRPGGIDPAPDENPTWPPRSFRRK